MTKNVDEAGSGASEHLADAPQEQGNAQLRGNHGHIAENDIKSRFCGINLVGADDAPEIEHREAVDLCGSKDDQRGKQQAPFFADAGGDFSIDGNDVP